MVELETVRSAVADKYALEKEIGRGGMATVFAATDVRLGRRVAIKVLDPDLAANVGADRFRREIQLVTALTHPNILAIYDSGEVDDLLYYVMPFVEGESLRARLEREPQLPIDDAVRIAVEVANALDYAHRHGVIHRDVKPENILLEDGHAIVADFGVARAAAAASDGTSLTRTGMALGTPMYMSPEQSMAEKTIDGRADQYALACVVYEMLAGHPPFTGGNVQSLIMRHAMDPVPSLRVVRQTVSEDLEAVILRGLEKSPADRFPTMRQFAEALVAPTGVTWAWKTTSSMPTIPARARRGDMKRWIVAAAILGIVVASGGMFAWRSRHDRALPAGADSRRVAILYFSDGSAKRTLSPLADGLTESLIRELGQVSALDVVSAGGVQPYRGTEAPRDSIARALQVGTLVDGSVDEDGQNVRLTVKLIDGSSGANLDTRTFSAPLDNALALRDSLADAVASALRGQIGQEIQVRAEKSETRDPQAWLLVLRARSARRDAEAAATDDDAATTARQFSLADTLLAAAERRDASWNTPIDERAWVAYRRARTTASDDSATFWSQAAIAHANRALARDARDAQALEVRGTARYFLYLAHLIPDPAAADSAYAAAEQDLVAATQSDPHDASAWTTLSHLYSTKPDFAQAKLAALNAYREDAYLAKASDILDRLYRTSYMTETFNDAEHWCTEGRKRFPKDARFTDCAIWLLTVPKLARTPSADSAWRLYAAEDALLPKDAAYSRHVAQMAVAIVLARAGLRDSAARVLVRERANTDVDPHSDLLFYEAYARLTMGERDTALDLLTQYLARNPEHRAGWRKDSAWWWRDLENDKRFLSLIGTG